MTPAEHSFSTADPTAAPPEAATASGRVGGLSRGATAAFLGIPFAAAPTGRRRFLAPQRPAPWDGTRICDRFGPTPQRRPFGPVTTIPEPSIPGDDTLSVNVFTPAPGDVRAGLPVFVWVHGGGYFAGSPASPWYDGSAFARDGVVVVTLSYRLGFDGFGWIEGAPLNRGVLDQIAALEWVQENIRSFGGDPARVTIGGQSAGGGSVLALLASPKAEGLFAGAISHSGAPGRTTVPEAEAVGRGFARALGIAPTLEAWRSVDEDTVLDHERKHNRLDDGTGDGSPAAVLAGIVREPLSTGLAFAPVADGEIVVAVDEAITAGAGSEVSLLLGATRNEFAFPQDVSADDVVAAARAAGVGEAGVDRFRAETATVGEQYAGSQLRVARMFRGPAVHVARTRAAAGAGSITWLYDFARHSPVDGLSAHCHDLPFAWDLLAADGVSRVLGDEPPQALADAMHADWVAFVATGRADWTPAADAPRGARVYDRDPVFDPEAYAFEADLLEERR
ncbi:carboxylesterase family protein [Microbacterium betulae]|uniref:Carboxylic ester hydrolase n=1 Tax=Microbacterium betulae TaxID=2981139 RepID=A0AA97I3L1_9MICO|nr:carboxylesterase family protein [Microbacterium sp. AB]WOF21556.1 carboxylesterase family protein [Microbacterium sp. AB]